MRAVRLLEYAIEQKPETVLDVGTGKGMHAFSFLANGSEVTGLDVVPGRIDHPNYKHVESAYELVKFDDQFDMVWCSHVLEHIPNVQHFLIWLREHLKPGGYLAIAVPASRQNRLHIGHLSLWTPAHLIYNLICAGWDCREALWYTEYLSIGLIVQKTEDLDMEGRTGMPSEGFWLNQYTPKKVYHEDGAWWGNNWHEETFPRVPDPPFVTLGFERSNLPPEVQLAFGPNPALRKPHGTQTT